MVIALELVWSLLTLSICVFGWKRTKLIIFQQAGFSLGLPTALSAHMASRVSQNRKQSDRSQEKRCASSRPRRAAAVRPDRPEAAAAPLLARFCADVANERQGIGLRSSRSPQCRDVGCCRPACLGADLSAVADLLVCAPPALPAVCARATLLLRKRWPMPCALAWARVAWTR